MREITKTISIPVDGNNQTVEAPVSINVTAANCLPSPYQEDGNYIQVC
jgi:hypothetical protein